MINAMMLLGLQASGFLFLALLLPGKVAMAAPSGCRTWVGVRGPAIPTRKEILNPNQQPGKRGSEEMHIRHPANSANRSKYTWDVPQ